MASKMNSLLYDERTATKRLNVATVAMSCDRDPDVNSTRIVDTVDAIMQAHPDTELIVFGEMILGWYNPADMLDYHRRMAERISLEAFHPFASLAARHRIYLCLGTPEIEGGSLYNAQVLLNPQGEIQAIHRKWNLKPGEKAAKFQPGPAPVTVTEIKGIKTGLVICSDAASPRAIWELMKSGLDLVILSLADDSDEGLFMARFNARMYDAWIVTANRYGDENGCFWDGHLVVSDPCGELRARGQGQEQYLVCELKCAADSSWMRTAIRNLYVKAPLVLHVLRNWRMARTYL